MKITDGEYFKWVDTGEALTRELVNLKFRVHNQLPPQLRAQVFSDLDVCVDTALTIALNFELLEKYNKMNELYSNAALNNMLDDDEPDFYGELKTAAWNVLHENPGYSFDEWVQTLMEQYPTEVVDALGPNPTEVYPALSDLWDSNDYTDEDTGECHTFAEWAEYFATERSVELYNLLVAEKRKISALEAKLNSKR